MAGQNVSPQEFLNFFVTLGLQHNPLVLETHFQLLIGDTLTGPDVSWCDENDDEVLEALRSPGPASVQSDLPNPSVAVTDENVPDEYEPRSPRTLAQLERIFESFKNDDDVIEAQLEDILETSSESHTSTFDEYEPRSPQTVERVEHLMDASEQHSETPASPQAGPSNVQIGGADNRQPPYRIELSGVKWFARATAIQSTYRVCFNEQWRGRRLTNLTRQLYDLFEELLRRAREGLADNDLIRVVIRHNGLNHAIVITLREVRLLDVQTILDKIQNVLQSQEDLAIDKSFQVIVGALRILQGTGRKRITKLIGPDNSIHRKTSKVQIVNDDQLCLARAIGVGLAKHGVIPDEEWQDLIKANEDKSNSEILVQDRKISLFGYKNIRNKTRQEQKRVALLLCQKARIPTDRPGSLNDLSAFEEALQVRIACVAASLGNKFIRVPSNEHADRPLIYVYLVDHRSVSHFHAIVNIAGFFSASYFCERCFKQYDHNTENRCESTCLTCKSQNCPETDTTMCCRGCHMTCRSRDCFDRHLEVKTNKKGQVKKSQCKSYWRCSTFKKVVNREQRSETRHECGEWRCKSCRQWVKGNHQCCLFPEEPKGPVKFFIFFDFEATQDQIAECEDGYAPEPCPDCPANDRCTKCRKCKRCEWSWCGQSQHVPNFVVAQTSCAYCEDETLRDWPTCQQCGSRCPDCDKYDSNLDCFEQPPCPDTCGFREVSFEGDSTSEDFGAWLFSEQHKNATVLAHNMKGYDGVFLLEYLVSHSMRPSKIIYNGSKIMYMEVTKGLEIRVLDSLNFLPMKLAALPKAFGLTELCKGYFPHFFNTRENQTYVGLYPDLDAYGVDYMCTWHGKTDQRKDFLNGTRRRPQPTPSSILGEKWKCTAGPT